MTTNNLSIIQQFMGREAGPVVQFIKYGIAGCMATATHLILFHFLAWRLLPALQDGDLVVRLLKLSVIVVDNATRAKNSMICNCITFIFSNMVAYLINIYWVFKPGRHKAFVELGLFLLVSLISLFVGTALMGFLINHFGMMTTYAFIANIVVSVMLNFTMRKFVIFKR